MADVQIANRNGKTGRQAPRIDLTPMVDLGFLLLTFFIMTTSMTKPKAMEVQMPFTPSKEQTVFYETSAITLMPAKDHRIFYYEGVYDPNIVLKEAALNTDEGIRTVLINKQKSIANRIKPDERKLQVLIKAHETATVADIVGLLDEMSILRIEYVAVVDAQPEEQGLVEKMLLTDR